MLNKHTKDGTDTVDTVSVDDNLIIKGNSQVVLDNLLPAYKGKAKIIYMDPPYNAGNNRFKYNDKMKSTEWLSSMKWRLITIRKLLKDDGVIFASVNDDEHVHLKLLMEEVFGRDNFVVGMINQRDTGVGSAKYIAKDHDYMLIYAKDKAIAIDGKGYVEGDDMSHFVKSLSNIIKSGSSQGS